MISSGKCYFSRRDNVPITIKCIDNEYSLTLDVSGDKARLLPPSVQSKARGSHQEVIAQSLLKISKTLVKFNIITQCSY